MKSQLKNVSLMASLLLFLSGCTFIVDPLPGPNGPAGNAYFGVDYDYAMPYSYWDNNQGIPLNPILGSFYPTNANIFDFEYFINPYEYWYGTYQIFRNAGGPGFADGQAGVAGRDTYLMLIVNPDGFYQESSGYKTEVTMGETIIIDKIIGDSQVRIELTKTTIQNRPTTNEPKYLNGQS